MNNQDTTEAVYTEKDLVEFGNYMVSDKRTELITGSDPFNGLSVEERLERVTHADLCNWQAEADI